MVGRAPDQARLLGEPFPGTLRYPGAGERYGFQSVVTFGPPCLKKLL